MEVYPASMTMYNFPVIERECRKAGVPLSANHGVLPNDPAIMVGSFGTRATKYSTLGLLVVGKHDLLDFPFLQLSHDLIIYYASPKEWHDLTKDIDPLFRSKIMEQLKATTFKRLLKW